MIFDCTPRTKSGTLCSNGGNGEASIDGPTAGCLNENDATVSTSVLLIDSSVADRDTLLAGLHPGVDAFLIKNGASANLAKQLETRGRINDLHIVTHGAPGVLSLGGDRVDAASLQSDHPLVRMLKAVTDAGSKVALWACNVGQSEIGSAFTAALTDLTGATVFAADSPVGAATKGGSWSIGLAAPFSAAAQAAYPHTLPTFDLTGATGNGTATGTETESGVTMTLTIDQGSSWIIADGGGLQGTVADLIAVGTSNINYTVTFTFSNAVTIDDFYYFEADNSTSGVTSWVFDVTGGNGTTITLTAGDFNAFNGVTVDPTDWTGVTSFTVTATGVAGFQPGFDTINFSTAPTNSAPTISGMPSDVNVLEDVSSNVDLSTLVVADADGDTLTVTLTVSDGSFSGLADGAGIGGGVTETLVNSSTITLVGSGVDINTYLDDPSRILYTGANDDAGDNAATLSINVSDGNGGNADAVSNIDIISVNDAPTAAGVPADIGFVEDTAGNLNLSSAFLSDVDSDIITLTITASEGNFNALADGSGIGGGVTETLVNSTTITLVGAPSDINSYLDAVSSIQWTPAPDDTGDNTSLFTLTANDGDGSGNIALATINADVTAVNDAPTLSGLVTDIAVNEATAGNVDLSASDFNDVDSAGTVFVTLTASSGSLSAVSGSGVTVAGTGTGTLTLTGTFVSINGFLNSPDAVQYTGATGVTGNDAAIITVSANDDDGSGDLVLGTVNVDIAPGGPGAIVGTNNDDTLIGTANSDSIIGLDGNDLINGIGGDDTLTGNGGDDTLIGGPGIDTADYSTSPGGVMVNLGTGTAANDGFGCSDTLTEIENAIGSSSADSLIGDRFDNTLIGGDGDDTINGKAGDDVLDGGRGNDTIEGGNGRDTLTGGDGNDILKGEGSRDLLSGGNGDDTLHGGNGRDTITGGVGDDLLKGDGDADIITAGDGNDDVQGGNGNDTLLGGSGNDLLTGAGGGDDILAGEGDDTIDGGNGRDFLVGGNGDDALTGGGDADDMHGGNGDDVLSGEAGNDRINGGAGNDTLTGGGGADTFVFDGPSGDDTVGDFAVDQDVLDLSATVTDFIDAASVQAAATDVTIGSVTGAMIDLGGGNSVFLEGVTVADLAGANYLF